MGQKELQRDVLEKGLCVHCGACVNLCPYAAAYKDKTVILDPCGREEGRCFAFCPRTFTDLEALRRAYEPGDLTAELGAVKGFYMTRAADEGIREGSQHGGTVTALLSLALEAGWVEAAVLAEEGEGFLPQGAAVREVSEVKRRAKSRFVASPNLAAFHQAAKGPSRKIGVVATPCQALALAKMRLKPFPEKDSHIDKLKLVIGLFCGWALSWRELKAFLETRFGGDSALSLDIPPSKHNALEVRTPKGTVEVPLDEVTPFVRPSCRSCWDLTAEFSDLSVGSARLPEGWQAARGWNQVITRTARGEELISLARARGVLEFRPMPEGNLERLKKASWKKKEAALRDLVRLSGDPADLLYLDSRDPVLKAVAGAAE